MLGPLITSIKLLLLSAYRKRVHFRVSPPPLSFPTRLQPTSCINPTTSAMVQAESSKTAERNGLRAVTAGTPADYELPWSVLFP